MRVSPEEWEEESELLASLDSSSRYRPVREGSYAPMEERWPGRCARAEERWPRRCSPPCRHSVWTCMALLTLLYRISKHWPSAQVTDHLNGTVLAPPFPAHIHPCGSYGNRGL